jgi:hypothetical protein
MSHNSESWYRGRIQPIEPEGFRFRPWIGVLASLLVFLAAAREGDGWMIVRAMALTGLFTSFAVSARRRREPNERISAWELRNVVFAGFCALVTLGFIVAWVIEHWPR